jgi:hypothetical protein
MTKHLVWFAVLLLTLWFGHLNGQRMERQYRAKISHKEDVIKGLRQDKAALYVNLTAALFQINGGKMSGEEIMRNASIYTENHMEWADLTFRTNLAVTELREDVQDNAFNARTF